MKTWVGLAGGTALVVLLSGVAVAQMGWGQMGPGMMAGNPCGGMMGPGSGWGGQMGPGMMMGQYGAAQVTEDKAKEAAQQYANNYLKGFTVDKVLPFTTGMGMTMYSVELKGPADELRILHVNPWGNVMPYGGPWRRSG